MYGICLSGGVGLSKNEASKLETRSAFILALVINIKFAKTITIFLAVYLDIYLYNVFYSYNESM